MTVTPDADGAASQLGRREKCSPTAEPEERSLAGVPVRAGLRGGLAPGEGAESGEETAAPELFDLEFWRDIARAEGLHVCEDAISSGAPSPAVVGALRRSLDDRGYLQSAPLLDDTEALERLRRASERLKRLGFAAAWLWIFDESWLVAERCWRLLAAVLAPDEPPATTSFGTVLLRRLDEMATAVRGSPTVTLKMVVRCSCRLAAARWRSMSLKP